MATTMTKRDRIGLYVLLGLFTMFGLMLFFTVDRPTGTQRSIENNVIVEQRMKNLKMRQ